jgi:tetratricopeptide (TPR) repeat protein
MLKAGELEHAFELASSLLQESPDDARLWALRGRVAEQQANYQSAIDDLSRAIAISPLEPDYVFTRGRYRLAADDCRGALEDFTETLRLCDHHVSDYYRESAYFFRAESFLCLRTYDEARADCANVRDDTRMWTTALRSKQDILDACDFSGFLTRVVDEARAGRVDAAVAAARDRMRAAESRRQDDEVVLCYTALLAVLAVARDDAASRAVRAERARRFPDDLDIQVSDLETLVWVDGEYAQGVERASGILARVRTDSALHRRDVVHEGAVSRGAGRPRGGHADPRANPVL